MRGVPSKRPWCCLKWTLAVGPCLAHSAGRRQAQAFRAWEVRACALLLGGAARMLAELLLHLSAVLPMRALGSNEGAV